MPRDNGTYEQIRQYVREHYGYYVGSNCIAEAKESVGLKPRQAHNRISADQRISSCPQESLEHIYAAFRFFGMPDKPTDI